MGFVQVLCGYCVGKCVGKISGKIRCVGKCVGKCVGRCVGFFKKVLTKIKEINIINLVSRKTAR